METVILTAEDERSLWEGYEAWLDEQADLADYDRMVEM